MALSMISLQLTLSGYPCHETISAVVQTRIASSRYVMKSFLKAFDYTVKFQIFFVCKNRPTHQTIVSVSRLENYFWKYWTTLLQFMPSLLRSSSTVHIRKSFLKVFEHTCISVFWRPSYKSPLESTRTHS